jgi:hypothetical protein
VLLVGVVQAASRQDPPSVRSLEASTDLQVSRVEKASSVLKRCDHL